MKDSTKLRIHVPKSLFESIAKEVLAEGKDGKSHAQRMTEKMMGKKKAKAPEMGKPEAAAPKVNNAKAPVKEVEGSNESLAKAIEALKVSMEKMEVAIEAAARFVYMKGELHYGSKPAEKDEDEGKDEVKEEDTKEDTEIVTLNETEEIDLFIKIGEWTVANFPKVADEMVGILRDKEALTDLGQFVVTLATAGSAAVTIPFMAAKKSMITAAKKLKDMAKASITTGKDADTALTEEADSILTSLPDDMIAKMAK